MSASVSQAVDLEAQLREFRATITGDFTMAEVADQFVAEMRAEDPATLEAWMDAHARRILTQMLSHSERGVRASAIRSGLRSKWVAPTKAELTLMRITFTIDAANTRRPLADMRAEDLLFAGAAYAATADQSARMATFMRALAKKVGSRTVSEVFTEERLAEMLRSFVGPAAGLLAA